MPETVITTVASQGSASTLGSNSQITGSASTPRKAVNTIRTVVSLSWKYLSTRNLSMWVETAHKSGPEKAKSNHINPSGLRWLERQLWPPPLAVRHARKRRGATSPDLLGLTSESERR